jgi:arabinofuranan 3-O-arabinosyltransferase
MSTADVRRYAVALDLARPGTRDRPVPSPDPGRAVRRPAHRHRRRRDPRALAGRWWRPALAVAVVLFAVSGPAHAFGRTTVVFWLCLVGLALATAAVPLGLLALRGRGRPVLDLPRRAALVAARPYLIVLALDVLIVSRWFRTGTFIAGGDMGAFIRRGWEPEMTWSWNHQITGAGSAAYTMARAFEFVLIRLCRLVGLTEYSAQWLYYTCIYGLVGFGVAYLAGAFVRSQAGIVVAGAFGMLNGFFLTRLPNPLNVISVGSVALITGVAMRVALGRRVPAPIAGFALMPTSFLSFNPPMLVVAYAWAVAGTPLLAALLIGRRAAWRLLRWFAAAVPWAICLNAWWLVPLAQSFTGGGGATANATFTDPTNWSWSQVNNVPPNILTMVANWAWFLPQYLPFAADLDRPWWIWIRYLLPALVFLAPLVASRRLRRVTLGLLVVILVFVFLAKGLRPPLAKINLFLYLHAPGFWLFREPMSKLGQLLISFFGVMLAVTVEGMLLRLRLLPRRRRPYGRVVAAAPVLLALAYPYPLYTGGVMPDERPTQPSMHVRVAQEWWDVAEHIDADPRPGKVFVLPLDDYYQMPTTWGFFGADSIANLLIKHPVVQPKPDGYFGDVPGFAAGLRLIESALLAGDLEPVPRLLDSIGASRVIVRHDLVRGLPNRYFADDRVLAAAMARVPGATLEVDGLLQVWRLGDGSSPTVRTYDRVLDAPARPDAGAAVLGTVGSGTAIAARPDAPAAATSPRVDDTAAVTPDVVHWPVPAVDRGSPVTTVRVPAGRYTVAQRARAAPALIPRVEGGDLLLEDPTVVRVDGRPVSRRPALRVPLPDGRPVLAIKPAGTRRVVSLDVDEPKPVPVGAATGLTLLAADPDPVKVSGFSPVFDCNNYEPRPWSELGLSAVTSDSKQGPAVRLTASDHAGCTRVIVDDAPAGQIYRIRMQYRHVSGPRPQICLWQSGAAGCELSTRLGLAKEWTPFEGVVTMDAGGTLQIILHADVGRRLSSPTVVEYRGVQVQALEEVGRPEVWPPAVPETTVDLAAGDHELRVDGGLSGSILSPFEPLEDCYRYDDQTAEQAGLAAEAQTGPDGETTYTLKAVSHLACIGAAAEDFGGASLYELSMEARSVALRNPKFCLYLRGPDLCRKLPTVAVYQGWTPYEALIPPDPNTVEARLYLYGLRDLEGTRQSQVEYRGVRIRPVASTSAVVLIRQDEPGAAAVADWERENPAHFAGTVTAAGPTVLAMAESAAPGWALTGIPGARKVTLQGWMSGWELPAGGDFAIRYGPARIARYAFYLLPVTVVLSVAFMYAVRLPAGRPGAWAVRHRRRRRRRWRR